jgi:hypothetical protein
MPLDPKLRDEIEKEAKRIEEDALHSGKGHYNAASPWRFWHRMLGVIAAVGSALAGVVVLKEWSPILAASAAAVATIASVIVATLKLNEEADRHHRAGDRYFSIKNKARILRNLELIQNEASDEKLVTAIKSMSSELNDARSGAPGIGRRFYKQAKKGLDAGEHDYQADQKNQAH